MGREEIYAEIEAERQYQEVKWGNASDDRNSPWEWVSFIANYATKWMKGLYAPLPRTDVTDFRLKMIKTAAIAVAAVESIDRQRVNNGGCFYEQSVVVDAVSGTGGPVPVPVTTATDPLGR